LGKFKISIISGSSSTSKIFISLGRNYLLLILVKITKKKVRQLELIINLTIQ